VALSGDLGTGKTEFIKGLAKGLGINERYHVSSPSFVLINEYPGRIPLYHIDLYRLSEWREMEELGLEEYVFGDGVTAIEWAEKTSASLPSQHIWIDILWKSPKNRQLIMTATGRHNLQILDAIDRELGKSFC
jgi:tRNA threonylcarbamoyladenosine biosynthesis protein TsaE